MSVDKKKELLDNWENYPDERKFLIGQAVWKVFHQYRKEITGYVHAEFSNEINQGKREMSGSLVDDVEKEVEHVLNEMLAGKETDKAELSTIRSRLKHLMDKPN